MTVERGNPTSTPRPKPKRASKKLLRASAWGAGVVAFLLPWGALAATPKPAMTTQSQQGQVVVLPPGTRLVSQPGPPGSGVKVVSVAGAKGSATAPVTTTGASAAPPPGV